MDTFQYYINIYLIPVVVVGILYVSVKKKTGNFMGKVLFERVLLSVEIGIISLIISWVPGDTTFGLVCIWGGSIVCLLFIVLACYTWFLYVFCLVKQTENLKPYRKTVLTAAIPLLVYLVLLPTTLWHNRLFRVSASGEYIRGSLAWLPYIIASGYLLSSSVMAWRASRREILKSRQQEYLNLVLFLVLPISGLLIQSLAYKYPATIPFTVLSLLIIYLNRLKGYSSLDSLTGLNNRRQFDRYLSARFSSPGRDCWCLIMLDLDGFKEINDVLGHTVGDEALIQMAQQLKYTFQDYKAFVARYGGDEFVAVVNCQNADILSEILEKLADNIRAFNERTDIPFTLHYSLGCAIYAENLKSSEDMLRAADAQMYENKKSHKESAISSVKKGVKL